MKEFNKRLKVSQDTDKQDIRVVERHFLSATNEDKSSDKQRFCDLSRDQENKRAYRQNIINEILR